MELAEWKDAEIDARTLYDVLKGRADDPSASSDDVRLSKIALRNWQFVSNQYPSPN